MVASRYNNREDAPVDLSLHPPLSAFPLTLLTLALFLEIARWTNLGGDSQRAWIGQASKFTVIAAALSVAAAFFSGYPASEHANQTFSVPDEAISGHHSMGKFLLFSMVPCVALFFAAESANYGKSVFKAAYRISLLLSVTLVACTGYLGGELVFRYGAGVSARISNEASPPSKEGTTSPRQASTDTHSP